MVINLNQASSQLTAIGGIKTRVIALLHLFVANVYYEREFSTLSETIFETYKKQVDELLLDNAADVLQKIP